jgi:hypothetical protein
MSLFAAHRPITNTAKPAADIDTAVGDNRRNTARKVGCMDLPSRYRLLRFYDKPGFKIVC